VTVPPPAARDRVWTVPNALSALRLAGIPLFLWLVLGPQADGWAVVVLAVSSISDYLDGWIARRFDQGSRLGELLDPAADRLYVLAALAALAIRGIVPIWLAAILVGRDLALAPTIPVLKRHGYGPLPVHFLGKAATLSLLYAFPMLLLSVEDNWFGRLVRPLGWAFTGWGTVLYLWAGILYVVQVRRLTSEPDG
jgi:cardiolipin synthase (CMP-forming)